MPLVVDFLSKYLNTLNPFFSFLLVFNFIKGKCLLFQQTESYSQNEGWLVNIILSDRNEMIEKEVQWSTSRISNPVTSYISKAATIVPFKWELWLFGAHDINYGKCSRKDALFCPAPLRHQKCRWSLSLSYALSHTVFQMWIRLTFRCTVHPQHLLQSE